ncbi:MAG: hypothetical protein GY749_06750 [Desulfobacteraceae bacterium]|nr:hypothetical protein [Desulfobacteraceae bacterium]
MEQQNSFRKVVGWLTIISVPFAFTNFALMAIAGSDSQDVSDFYYFLKAGEEAGYLMKWSWLADLLGYYLLLVPAAFFMYYWLKNKNPYWMGVFSFCGLAYIFAGCIGAAILAKTWPTLISGYANTNGITKEIYSIVFTNSTEMVYGGIWGYLEFLLAGIWWIGVGFTMKSERKALGIITIILGIFTLATVVGEVFTLEYIALAGLMIYLLLAPIWAGWLGISLVRGKDMQLANP